MGEPFISYGAFLTCSRSDAPPNTALFPRSPQRPKSGPGSESASVISKLLCLFQGSVGPQEGSLWVQACLSCVRGWEATGSHRVRLSVV